MHIGIISAAYLIVFLPLVTSLICTIIARPKLSFFLTIFCCVTVFFLTFFLVPEVLLSDKISHSPAIVMAPLTTEFSLNMLGAVFVLLIVLLKNINLLYNSHKLFELANKGLAKNFYPALLLNLFAAIGVCLTDNLINFLLFLELYSLGFFALLSLSQERDLSQIFFRNFSLNIAASLLMILSLFVPYMIFGDKNFNEYASAIAMQPDHHWFFGLLFLMSLTATLIKFFPIHSYFSKLESQATFASFLAAEVIFTRVLLGIFVVTKLFYLFNPTRIFENFYFAEAMTFAAIMLIIFSTIKLYREKKPRLITVHFCFINVGFILICLAFPSYETLQAMFFFLLNFALVNLLFFLCLDLLIESEKVTQPTKKSHLAVLPSLIITTCIIAFPMTILFFANWHFALGFFNKSLLSLCLLGLLTVVNLIYFNLGTKLIPIFFSKLTNSHVLKISAGNYLCSISFWFVALAILVMSLNPLLIGSIAVEFAHFLLPNLQQ